MFKRQAVHRVLTALCCRRPTEVGSSLLRHPSPELSRLISAHGSLSKGERNFQWPVLAFVIQHHDLEGLEVAMRHALRKSACRVFAMEV